jgi:hypothetical protein
MLLASPVSLVESVTAIPAVGVPTTVVVMVIELGFFGVEGVLPPPLQADKANAATATR